MTLKKATEAGQHSSKEDSRGQSNQRIIGSAVLDNAAIHQPTGSQHQRQRQHQAQKAHEPEA